MGDLVVIGQNIIINLMLTLATFNSLSYLIGFKDINLY